MRVAWGSWLVGIVACGSPADDTADPVDDRAIVVGDAVELDPMVGAAPRPFSVADGGRLMTFSETFDAVVDDEGLGVRPIDVEPPERPGDAPVVVRGAEVRVETVRVTRGDAVDTDGARPTGELGGWVSVPRGPATEVLRASAAGVEQRWRFDEEPVGNGPIEVDLRVDGAVWVGLGPDGHRFVDEATGLGVVYGPGTWVDAAGSRWPVAVDRVDGGLRLTVAEDVVLATSWPAVLDPLIRPERAFGQPLVGSSWSYAGAHDVACNASGCLAVWEDTRKDPRGGDLWATRLSPTGAPLDPGGFRLTDAPLRRETAPRLVAGPTGFALVWIQEPPAFYGEFETWLLELDPGGAPLGPPVRVGQWFDFSIPARPAVVWLDDAWRVFTALRPGSAGGLSRLESARVDQGVVSDVTSYVIDRSYDFDPAFTLGAPGVALRGDRVEIVVAGSQTVDDVHRLYLLEFDDRARPLSDGAMDTIDLLGPAGEIALTCDPRGCLYALNGWGGVHAGFIADSFLTTPDLLDTRADARFPYVSGPPAVAILDGAYAVAWDDTDSLDGTGAVHLEWLGAFGAPLAGAVVRQPDVGQFAGAPRVASDGRDLVVTWAEQGAFGLGAWAQRWSPVATPASTPVELSQVVVNTQRDPAMVRQHVGLGSDRSAIVWVDDRGTGTFSVMGGCLDAQGGLVGSAVLASGPGDRANPDVAKRGGPASFGATQMFAVWEERSPAVGASPGRSTIVGRRFTCGESAISLGTDLVTPMFNASGVVFRAPKVAYLIGPSAGDERGVVIAEANVGGRDTLQAQVIDFRGRPQGSFVVRDQAAVAARDPDVSAGLDGFYATWTEWEQDGDTDVWFVRLSLGDLLRSPSSYVASPRLVTREPWPQGRARVAANPGLLGQPSRLYPDGAIVVFEDDRGERTRLYSALLLPDAGGSITGNQWPLVDDRRTDYVPPDVDQRLHQVVVSDESRYAALYTLHRDDGTTDTAVVSIPRTVLIADANSSLLGPIEDDAALGRLAPGRFLVAWQAFVAGWDRERVRARPVLSELLPADRD